MTLTGTKILLIIIINVTWLNFILDKISQVEFAIPQVELLRDKKLHVGFFLL